MQCYVSGIVPISTVDLADTVCSAVFFAGCDFRCPYCYNASILDFKEEFLRDIREVKKQIDKNVPFIDALLFCGGEPTLQRQALVTLAAFAKEKGLLVAVETNGSRPSVLKELLEKGLVDTIIWDMKTPFVQDMFAKVTRSSTFFVPTDDIMNAVRKTYELLKRVPENVTVVVRTTIVPMLMYRKEHLIEMAYDIKELGAEWELRPFVASKKVLSPRFQNMNPPSGEFLKDLKKACLAEYPQLTIRIKHHSTA